MHTLTAEVWRRAGRFDEALEECAAADSRARPRPGRARDDDGERVGTATVASFVRNLAIAGDDDARSCAEAFADDE